MAVLEHRRDGPDGAPEPRAQWAAETDLVVDQAWREDVALEIWVDVTSEAVVIRLEGVLDGATGANLGDVVQGCLAEGARTYVLDTKALCMERGGWGVIARLRAQIEGAGGRLRWDAIVERG